MAKDGEAMRARKVLDDERDSLPEWPSGKPFPRFRTLAEEEKFYASWSFAEDMGAGTEDLTPDCSAPNCERPARSLGLCEAHYRRSRRGKPLSPIGARSGRTQGEPTTMVATKLPKRSMRLLEAWARREGISIYALVRRIVEERLRT